MTEPTMTERPAFADVPHRRFWGDAKPPKNRAEMFSMTVRNATEVPAGESAPVATGKTATLRVYGPIDSWGGFWGVSARDVSDALDSLPDDVTEIQVRINSVGGEVWEGLAITNMLRAHQARIVTVVDGLAASAASVIACSGDERVMAPGTSMMIHDVSTFAYGNAATMRKAGEILDSISGSLADLYAEYAGGSSEGWRGLMIEETWYSAKEAVDAQLADRVGVVKDAGQTETAGAEEETVVVIPADGDPVEDRFDLSIFMHAGRDDAPAPKPPSASAAGSSHTEGGSAVGFTDAQMTDLRRKLGVAEDADEATILAALDESLDERAEAPAPINTAIPEGHTVIPAAKLADLEAAAKLATTTAKSLHDKERDTFLDSQRGKYLPTSRAGWEAEYDRDPAAVRAHFEEAAVIIPTAAAGHDQGSEGTTPAIDDDELAAFAASFGLTKEDLRG